MYQLATAYQQAGQLAEAQKVLRKLVETFPDSPWQRDAQQLLASLS
jgi:TolA-binding protein